jgi:hypothetical protein
MKDKLIAMIKSLKESEGGRSNVVKSVLLREMERLPFAVHADSAKHLLSSLSHFMRPCEEEVKLFQMSS